MRRLIDGIYIPPGLCVDWANGPLVQYLRPGRDRWRFRLKVIGRWRLEALYITTGRRRGLDWGG